MKLEVYRTVWGLVPYGDDVVPFLPGIAAAGYDGVCVATYSMPDSGAFAEAAAQHGLAVLPQIQTRGRSVEEHLEQFRDGLKHIGPLSPRFVIAQAGRDAFSDDEAEEFFAAALDAEADAGIPVAHETHRGRILFTPWRTLSMLERFPELKLNCDFSHFVIVAERLRFGADIVEACASRALHFDARVGWEEGPQVHDPRAPEFAGHLDAYLGWWDAIWDSQSARGLEVTSFMPEFGPPPYQPLLPNDGSPVGDIVELSDWMAGFLRDRFESRS